MNYVDLFIIIVFLALVLEGYARGFFVSLLSLVRFAVGIPFSFIIADKCSGMVYENFFRDNIRADVLSGIESSGLDTYVSSIKDTVNSLPTVMKGSVDMSFLDHATAASAADGIMTHILDPIVGIMIKAALFVVTLLLFYVI
ncbi:MAG: hypothetical protein K2J55_06360, partial [Eubacterium sp.]|nr:hypothetical protein [Eubacterium sp.]